MSYDIEPLRVMEEKARLLAEAAAGGWVVCFEHDPKLAACTIQPDTGGFWAVKDVLEL